MNIIKEEFIPDAKAKEILENIAKERELKYEQKNSLDILRKFVKIDGKTAEKIMEQLSSIEKLREKQRVAIVNFLPKDNDELRAVLHKEYASFSKEEIEKILEIVKSI